MSHWASVMKFLAASLFAVACLASQALASNFLINPYAYAGGTPFPSISFVGCETPQTANQTSYTFTNAAMGAAGNRHTIVVIGVTDTGTTLGISGVTVGGNSAAEVVDEDGSLALDTAIYIISNPSGTTATVVVTPTEQVESAIICIFAAYDLTSATAFASVADDDTSSGALVLNHNVPANGVSVGFCLTKQSAETTTWIGLTENAPETSHAEGTGSTAMLNPGSASTPLTASCDWGGTNDASGVAASWQ